MKADLLGLSRAELGEALAPYIDRPFRADQIHRAVYHRGIVSFAEMTDLSRELRQELDSRFTVAPPRIVEVDSDDEATRKVVFALADGATIEAVDIPEGSRRTLCISSQAGCALGCRFCVTGYWGAGRNLTAGEIVGQVLAINSLAIDDEPTAASAERTPGFAGLNLVFMGMGEPLLNLDHLARAVDILTEQISRRRITVSTAGVVPGIAAMAEWPRRPRLAISLHAPDDARRSRMMPINRTYPLTELLAALRRFPLEPKERLTFEYILIDGFNDALADADALAALLRPLRSKVNLIPLNPDPVLGDLRPPGEDRCDAFRRRLIGHGLTTTLRKRRGDEVRAACGQLRAPGRAPRGFRGSAERNLRPAR